METNKAKILFVDDEKQILVSLRALFRLQYHVLTATSGAEALDIIRKEHIDVIVSDQRMPQMLGHELLREVKMISPNTMRLLLTGYSDQAAIMHSINEGEVFRFIAKPWNNTELRATIDSAADIARNTLGKVVITDDDVATAHHLSAGVLVLDDDCAIADHVKTSTPSCPVHVAHSVEQAIDILSQDEIGLIVTDTVINGEDTTDLIKLLKQQYPAIMTILLTDAMDSDLAVELINQGQIYRYLRKTANNAALKLSIQHGLRFYQTNKAKPELLQRHKVEAVKPRHNPSLVEKLTGRLSLLRMRLGFG